MKIDSYAIHDIIRFQIKNLTDPVKNQFDTISIQFQNFVSDKNSPYDFTVGIGPFSRENRTCTIIDDTYHIADDYIYFKDSRKLSKWEVEISEIEELPRTKIATNFVGNITAPLNIVEFLIQYCLLKKGIPFIHASGVSKEEKCVVFPARSGAGKTTVALSLLERGFSYLSDNYIILDKGTAKNYLSPLNIFTYNRLPIIEKALSKKQRVSMFFKTGLYTITEGHFKIFEKINPMNIFKDLIANNSPVCLICLLEVNSSLINGQLSSKRIAKDKLIKKLRYNMELDLLPFSKCIYSYGYVFPNRTFSSFWEMYEQTLERNLPRDASFISIEVPPTWHENSIDKIVELINRYLG